MAVGGVGEQLVWLEASVDPEEVGLRAATLARLRGGGMAVPRAFAIGRRAFSDFALAVQSPDPTTLRSVKLPDNLSAAICAGVRELGTPCAVRRSPLASHKEPDTGGRPESFLHLVDEAEVTEAVRRVWGRGLSLGMPEVTVAIIVQNFVVADACALVRADGRVLRVESSYGIGDLLAAKLVVPDRHSVTREGAVTWRRLGRKAQMSVPRQEGGVTRVPVPTDQALRMALSEEDLRTLAAAWRRAETLVGPMFSMRFAIAAGKPFVTGAIPAPVALDPVMVG